MFKIILFVTYIIIYSVVSFFDLIYLQCTLNKNCEFGVSYFLLFQLGANLIISAIFFISLIFIKFKIRTLKWLALFFLISPAIPLIFGLFNYNQSVVVAWYLISTYSFIPVLVIVITETCLDFIERSKLSKSGIIQDVYK